MANEENNTVEKSFPQKYLNKLKGSTEFLETVESLDTEEMKKKILECEQNIYEIENAKENDTKLTSAKTEAKEFAAPYTESKNIEAAKIKYCLFLLEQRGISL